MHGNCRKIIHPLRHERRSFHAYPDRSLVCYTHFRVNTVDGNRQFVQVVFVFGRFGVDGLRIFPDIPADFIH